MSSLSNKIASADSLEDTLSTLEHPIVFTNGCFDILHRGHVAYLEQARRLGRTLIVGVNSDTSVRRLEKGANRPLNCLADRMAVLAALESVDLVVAFEEDTPLELIKRIGPDCLVKGGDWHVDEIVGADFVTKAGGHVRSIPIEFERSTTDMIRRIRSLDQ